MTPTAALLDLSDVLAVNPDSPASDPTVFHKRYLKKIRDLGEVRGSGGWGGPEVSSGNMGGAWPRRPRFKGVRVPAPTEEMGPGIFQVHPARGWGLGSRGRAHPPAPSRARAISARSVCTATTPRTTAPVRWWP